MKKKIALAILGLGVSTTAFSQVRPMGAWPFNAPSVSGTGSLVPTPGDIIYNTSLNSFYGWNGANWLNFSPGAFLYNVDPVKTTGYNAVASDNVIPVNASLGGFSVNLYDATTNQGGTITIKKEGSDVNVVTITPFGSQSIDGVTGNYTVCTPGESVTLVSDGSNWLVLSHKTETAWVAYTPTFVGTATPTGVAIYSKRSGTDLKVQGYFTAGTTNSSIASMQLGFNGTSGNVTIAGTSMFPTGPTIIGTAAQGATSTGRTALLTVLGSASGTVAQFATANDNFTNNPLVALTGTNVWVSGTQYAFSFSVPISGWEP